MADLTDSERDFATGDFNGDDERPRLESFSFEDVTEFACHGEITFDEQRSRDAQTKLLNREADALAFIGQ